MLIEDDCRRRGVREAVAIDLYTPEPGPMPTAGPEVSKQVRQMVEAKGIGYHPEHAVTGIPLASGKPLPKAGVFAPAEAETVARNIADEIDGKPLAARFNGHGACFVETGGSRAGFGRGDFFADPAPAIKLEPPGRLRHWAKAAYEKYWLYKWLK